LAFATSCQTDDDDDRFRIIALEFDGESTITLSFSEPVAELGDVDPSSFRLSLGTTYRFTYSYDGTTYTEETTNYFDVGAFVSTAGGYYEQVTVASLMPGSSADRIVLATSGVWGQDACGFVSYLQAQWEAYESSYYAADVGIFLHYAAGDVPLESASGSSLADIGADWVIDGTNQQSEYGFVRLKPQLRIPCP
jgi:hypothetical protein